MIYVTRIYTYTVQVIQSARPTMESGRGYASADLLEIHLKSIFPCKTSLKKNPSKFIYKSSLKTSQFSSPSQKTNGSNRKDTDIPHQPQGTSRVGTGIHLSAPDRPQI